MASDDTVSAPFVEATFACAKCGREAARVSVRPRGMAGPRPERDLLPLNRDRVVIEAGQLSTSMAGLSVDAAIPDVLRALGSGDPAALFAADFELAPFWCPTCGSAYCADEWAIWPVYDEDDAEWLEELRGRCPVGHERMLQD